MMRGLQPMVIELFIVSENPEINTLLGLRQKSIEEWATLAKNTFVK